MYDELEKVKNKSDEAAQYFCDDRWCSRSCGNLLGTFRKLSRYVHELRPAGDLGANAIVAYANKKGLSLRSCSAYEYN